MKKRNTAAFNSSIEVGLRSLLILKHAQSALSLERLITYDYLCLNTADINGPSSLHAPVPHRSVQLFVRRGIIQDGLKLLIAKGLVGVDYVADGIHYAATELTDPFLKHLDTSYRHEFEKRAEWVVAKFSSMSEEELRSYININLDKWGGELTEESTIEG